jgi:two-component system cell cycle sensor histidine kinase/response regulator CckA
MASSGLPPGLVPDEGLRRLFDSFPGAVWVTDRDLRVREAYGKDVEALGLSPHAVRGRTLGEILGADGEVALAAHRRALEGANGGYELSFRGRLRRSRVEPLEDLSGVVQGVVGMSVDVTDLQVAEHQLAVSGAIVASSSDAIIGKSLDGTVTSWNAGAERIYGYRASEIIGDSVARIVPPELLEELGPILERAARGEATENLITTRLRKDGERITVALTVSPIRARDGSIIGSSTIARDITEPLLVEAALHASEALTRSVVESALDAVVMIDGEGAILEFNPAAVAMFGREREHVLGRQMVDLLVPPALRESHLQGFARHLATGESRILGERLELSALRADGSEFPVELAILRVPGEGAPVFTGFVRDITDRKAAEAGLRHLAAIVETSEDAIVTRAPDGTVLTWNPGAERLFGFAAEEIVGRSIDVLLPDDARGELSMLRERLGRGERVPAFQLHLRRKDGSDVAVSSVTWPIMDANGDVVAVAGIMRDITPLLAAQEALQRSEETYRRLFERHPAPMWLFDPNTLRFRAVNESAIEMYGYTREEFLALTIEQIRPEEDLDALREAVSDPERIRGVPGVWRHRKKDGTLIDVHVESNQIEFEGRMVRLVLAQDVTAQRRLEEQLRQTQKMEAIGSLAGGIAHDFNNILLVIRATSGMLLEQLQGEARERVLEIDLAAQRGAEVTQQLLAFSRQQILRPEAVDLTTVLDETLALVGRLIGEDIELVKALERGLRPVLIDRSQLQQVILNLLVNARDAMSDGGTLTVRAAQADIDARYADSHVEVTAGSYVLLEVTDTGSGMDEHTRARVFDPFFTTKEEGTGLGLATVFGILKQSGGHVAVYSEPGIGTTFRVYLRPAAGPVQEHAPTTSVETLSGEETILVVEDTQAVRRLVVQILEPHGYTVIAASDGLEALELAQRTPHRIDLLLTDVVMPRLSGRELAERLAVQLPSLKVLFTSGYPADTVVRHGIAEARVAFIQKPYAVDDLLFVVRQALDAAVTDDAT